MFKVIFGVIIKIGFRIVGFGGGFFLKLFMVWIILVSLGVCKFLRDRVK